MATRVISFPIPAFSNVQIQSDFYQPSVFVISAIALGITTTVTTTTNHNYVIGQQVRLTIPYGFGTIDLNEKSAIVIAIPAVNQVTLDISSIGMSLFFDNPASTTKAQIMAIGDVNSGQINSSGRINNITFINGSFINISPQ